MPPSNTTQPPRLYVAHTHTRKHAATLETPTHEPTQPPGHYVAHTYTVILKLPLNLKIHIKSWNSNKIPEIPIKS
jgi:hypothetical protein